jgi:hypothetical protein
MLGALYLDLHSNHFIAPTRAPAHRAGLDVAWTWSEDSAMVPKHMESLGFFGCDKSNRDRMTGNPSAVDPTARPKNTRAFM